MRNILIFCGKCLILSLVLVAVLPGFDGACRFVLALLIHRRLPTPELMSALPYVSAVKLLPFFIFVLAASGISVGRRVAGIGVAVLLYLLLDLVMTVIWPVMPHRLPSPDLKHLLSTQLWEMVGRWLLPFVLAAFVIFGGKGGVSLRGVAGGNYR